jgi:1,4-dihydroxy-2-naphthoate polyprenyltransferase
MHPTGWHLWWTAARPRTLTIAITPVIVGSSLAWAEGLKPDWTIFLLALACAVLIQIGTNLLNDVTDFERGNDRADRLGPLRVTAAGWATPKEVRRIAWRVFGTAVLIGLGLVWFGGPTILVVGLASIAAGWAYSGGARPISHTPFGELFVLAFFGLVAVGGSHYLQAGHWSRLSLPAGMAVGAMAAAVLMVNNYRDLAGDVAAGRRTLVAVLGSARSRVLYGILVLLPFVLPLWLALRQPAMPFALLALMALPAGFLAMRGLRLGRGAALNRVLALTSMVQLAFGLLLALGVCL